MTRNKRDQRWPSCHSTGVTCVPCSARSPMMTTVMILGRHGEQAKCSVKSWRAGERRSQHDETLLRVFSPCLSHKCVYPCLLLLKNNKKKKRQRRVEQLSRQQEQGVVPEAGMNPTSLSASGGAPRLVEGCGLWTRGP